MFAKSTLVFIFFTLCGFVAAFTPACVIGAVNTQKDPSDFDTLCGSASTSVQKQVLKFCKDDSEAGLKTFKSICSDAGYDIKLIDNNTSSSSASSTASSTGSMTTSKSSPTSTSGSDSSSGSGSSPSNTSSPSSEPNAGSLHKADSMFAALVVAIVGAIAL